MWCCSLADTCASAQGVLHCWQALRVPSAAARCSAPSPCSCESDAATKMLAHDAQPYCMLLMTCICQVIVSSSDKV